MYYVSFRLYMPSLNESMSTTRAMLTISMGPFYQRFFRPVISRSIICSVNYGIHHHTNLNCLMLFYRTVYNVLNTSFILKLYLYLSDSIDHKIVILPKLSLRSLIRLAPGPCNPSFHHMFHALLTN